MRAVDHPHRSEVSVSTGALEAGYVNVVDEIFGDQFVDEVVPAD